MPANTLVAIPAPTNKLLFTSGLPTWQVTWRQWPAYIDRSLFYWTIGPLQRDANRVICYSLTLSRVHTTDACSLVSFISFWTVVININTAKLDDFFTLITISIIIQMFKTLLFNQTIGAKHLTKRNLQVPKLLWTRKAPACLLTLL